MASLWSDSLLIGVREIDNQHKELFHRVEKLLDACNEGRGKEAVSEVLDFLESYVVEHFGAEEKLMTKHGYPDYAAHKAGHEDFIKSFAGLKKEFATEGPSLRIVILTNRVVVDWLRNHISKVDKALGAFLQSRPA